MKKGSQNTIRDRGRRRGHITKGEEGDRAGVTEHEAGEEAHEGSQDKRQERRKRD